MEAAGNSSIGGRPRNSPAAHSLTSSLSSGGSRSSPRASWAARLIEPADAQPRSSSRHWGRSSSSGQAGLVDWSIRVDVLPDIWGSVCSSGWGRASASWWETVMYLPIDWRKYSVSAVRRETRCAAAPPASDAWMRGFKGSRSGRDSHKTQSSHCRRRRREGKCFGAWGKRELFVRALVRIRSCRPIADQ